MFFNSSILNNYYKNVLKEERVVHYGEIACTLSHILCWQKIAENTELSELDYAVIAEDDIQLFLDSDFDKFLPFLFKYIKQNNISYKIIILHQFLRKDCFEKKIISYHECHLYDNLLDSDINDNGSSLYLIRKDHAIALLRVLKTVKPYWLADHFTAIAEKKDIAILYPYLGSIADMADSDLAKEREELKCG